MYKAVIKTIIFLSSGVTSNHVSGHVSTLVPTDIDYATYAGGGVVGFFVSGSAHIGLGDFGPPWDKCFPIVIGCVEKGYMIYMKINWYL